ncbi:MAG: hypothetical protein ABIE74_06420 [Pseudomonadota bacterium]
MKNIGFNIGQGMSPFNGVKGWVNHVKQAPDAPLQQATDVIHAWKGVLQKSGYTPLANRMGEMNNFYTLSRGYDLFESCILDALEPTLDPGKGIFLGCAVALKNILNLDDWDLATVGIIRSVETIAAQLLEIEKQPEIVVTEIFEADTPVEKLVGFAAILEENDKTNCDKGFWVKLSGEVFPEQNNVPGTRYVRPNPSRGDSYHFFLQSSDHLMRNSIEFRSDVIYFVRWCKHYRSDSEQITPFQIFKKGILTPHQLISLYRALDCKTIPNLEIYYLGSDNSLLDFTTPRNLPMLLKDPITGEKIMLPNTTTPEGTHWVLLSDGKIEVYSATQSVTEKIKRWEYITRGLLTPLMYSNTFNYKLIQLTPNGTLSEYRASEPSPIIFEDPDTGEVQLLPKELDRNWQVDSNGTFIERKEEGYRVYTLGDMLYDGILNIAQVRTMLERAKHGYFHKLAVEEYWDSDLWQINRTILHTIAERDHCDEPLSIAEIGHLEQKRELSENSRFVDLKTDKNRKIIGLKVYLGKNGHGSFDSEFYLHLYRDSNGKFRTMITNRKKDIFNENIDIMDILWNRYLSPNQLRQLLYILYPKRDEMRMNISYKVKVKKGWFKKDEKMVGEELSLKRNEPKKLKGTDITVTLKTKQLHSNDQWPNILGLFPSHRPYIEITRAGKSEFKNDKVNTYFIRSGVNPNDSLDVSDLVTLVAGQTHETKLSSDSNENSVHISVHSEHEAKKFVFLAHVIY